MSGALVLQVDGTPGSPPRGVAGLGIVVRRVSGAPVRCHTARAAATTNNEAEYQALIAGLELLLACFPGARCCVLTDSQIVVEQLAGRSAVRAPQLVPLHARATELLARCHQPTLHLIGRELNLLADALAWEALAGRGRLRAAVHQATHIAD